jgi:hypothetical protein
MVIYRIIPEDLYQSLLERGLISPSIVGGGVSAVETTHDCKVAEGNGWVSFEVNYKIE